MIAQQLELPLWSQLQSAHLTPETVDMNALLNHTERAIAQLPESKQMQAAGEAMLQLVQLTTDRGQRSQDQRLKKLQQQVKRLGYQVQLVPLAVPLSKQVYWLLASKALLKY